VSRQVLVLFCAFAVCNCYSTDTPEAWVGSYRSTGAPAFALELRADDTVVEKIGGRELKGRWSLWRVSDRGCGEATSIIELTGLVFDPREPQTNNRIRAYLEGWPRKKLVLHLGNGKKLELRRESTPP
jgi:hypothetical protein